LRGEAARHLPPIGPILHKAAAMRRDGEAQEAIRCALIDAIVVVCPSAVGDDPRTWPRVRRLDGLALGLVGGDTVQVGTEEGTGDLLTSLGKYRHSALAAYGQAEQFFERALAIREKALGPEHPDTAASLSNLAAPLREQRDLAGAWPLYERALAICEKVLGPEQPLRR
jgi:hypothetical protein